MTDRTKRSADEMNDQQLDDVSGGMRIGLQNNGTVPLAAGRGAMAGSRQQKKTFAQKLGGLGKRAKVQFD